MRALFKYIRLRCLSGRRDRSCPCCANSNAPSHSTGPEPGRIAEMGTRRMHCVRMPALPYLCPRHASRRCKGSVSSGRLRWERLGTCHKVRHTKQHTAGKITSGCELGTGERSRGRSTQERPIPNRPVPIVLGQEVVVVCKRHDIGSTSYAGKGSAITGEGQQSQYSPRWRTLPR